MAELEELGFLTHPHTSAGRVPTERGYRYYIDSLISFEPDSEEMEDQLRNVPEVSVLHGERSSGADGGGKPVPGYPVPLCRGCHSAVRARGQI